MKRKIRRPFNFGTGNSPEYLAGWDRIFGKPMENSCAGTGSLGKPREGLQQGIEMPRDPLAKEARQ